MTDDGGEIVLCCLLWSHDGTEDDLTTYEDRVLALVPDTGGEVVQRVASDGADGSPNEVQVFRFPSQHALDAYLDDPRRTALAAERDRVIARTQLFPVSLR
jgi:hypothetical protein